MQTKQVIAVVSVVSMLSAGLGVVLASRLAPQEIKVSLDLPQPQAATEIQAASQVATSGASISANELLAVATLRLICTAQGKLQASGTLDQDGDGGGEYGNLSQLSSTGALDNVVAKLPSTLRQAMVQDPLTDLAPDSRDGCVAERAGYYFKIYLPGPTDDTRTIQGVAESCTSKPTGSVDPDNGEVIWCCYAWPVDVDVTGRRAFFINQEQDLLQTLNIWSSASVLYNGLDATPHCDAAYEDGTTSEWKGMAASLGIYSQGLGSNDGNIWTLVGQ